MFHKVYCNCVHLFFEVFYLLLNILRCCDCHCYVSKKFDIQLLKACFFPAVLAIFPKFFLVTSIIVVLALSFMRETLLLFEKVSNCILNSIFHLFYPTLFIRIKPKTHIFKVCSVRIIPNQGDLDHPVYGLKNLYI